MDRAELEAYIMDKYNADTDFPWIKYPKHQVFRHSNNKKWFALMMSIPKEKLGLTGKEPIEVVNFKCDSILIGSLLNEKGFFPAYHMSKTSWVTVALDGSVPDDEIKMLLDLSYNATAAKLKEKKGRKNGAYTD